MASFLNIVEAIHPRGGQTQTRVEPSKPVKNALSASPGKTTVSKINFLVDALPHLTRDQAFESDKANKAFFAFNQLHHRVYKGTNLATQIEAAVKAAELAPVVLSELEKLFKAGSLPGVTQKDMDAYSAVVSAVVREAEPLRNLLEELTRLKTEAWKLGFGKH